MWTVDIKRAARKQLERIDKKSAKRIAEKIEGLSKNPLPANVKKLRHEPGYRERAGDYRIIYEIDFKTKSVYISKIGLRGKVYRR